MLCLSGFELYSRWVPLFFLSPSSKTRESLLKTLAKVITATQNIGHIHILLLQGSV